MPAKPYEAGWAAITGLETPAVLPSLHAHKPSSPAPMQVLLGAGITTQQSFSHRFFLTLCTT